MKEPDRPERARSVGVPGTRTETRAGTFANTESEGRPGRAGVRGPGEF